MKTHALKGKTALVTGGAKRIGRAIALGLAGTGINVVIHYNSSEKEAGETVSQACDRGVRAWKVRGDLTITTEAERVFQEAVDAAGAIDFLINNASVFTASVLSDIDYDDLRATLGLNAVAPLVLSECFARQKGDGVIINLLDSRIKHYDLNHVSYQISKNILYYLTEALAVEYAPRIRVNAVAPGLILPPAGKDESYLKRLSHNTLLNRHGDPSDITDAVLFLLSSTFITGEVIYVDGGQNLKEISSKRDQS